MLEYTQTSSNCMQRVCSRPLDILWYFPSSFRSPRGCKVVQLDDWCDTFMPPSTPVVLNNKSLLFGPWSCFLTPLCLNFIFSLPQGTVCSRAMMMQKLNDFVGADMGDVDRYVLKQGSTMVGLSRQNNRLP